MNTHKTQPCPECGGKMRYKTRDETIDYLGHSRTIQTLAWWCSKCGEGILSGPPLLASEKAYLELKAEVDGVLGPDEIAVARKLIGLSQRKASELLGGGPRSFQKYEAGKQAASVPMSRLLTLLSNDPKRLRELPGAPKATKRSIKSA